MFSINIIIFKYRNLGYLWNKWFEFDFIWDYVIIYMGFCLIDFRFFFFCKDILWFMIFNDLFIWKEYYR